VSANGARIVELAAGGPAAAAGLPVGAVITKVDDQVISTAGALVAAVQSKAPGTTIALGYLDPSGAARTAQVLLGTDQGSAVTRIGASVS
jgi:putative serine protease PepD